MSSGVLDAALSPPRLKWGTATLLALAGLIAVVFFAVAALPYYLSSSYGPPGYAPRRGWLLLHIAGGAVALLTGPLQLWLGLSDRGIAWHRRLGVIYMTAVGVGSIAAFYLATHTDFGWIFPALQAARIGVLNEQLALSAWACWAVPMLVTELVLQGRKILAVKLA